MRSLSITLIALQFLLNLTLPFSSLAIEKLEVKAEGFKPGGRIPDKYAYCKMDSINHTTKGENISPAISWSEGPKGTKSYAIIMVDPDVPAIFDDANKDGKIIPADMPRRNFYHLIRFVSKVVQELEEGGESTYKTSSVMTNGTREKNDFGNYGYDGPCPPWNDKKLHHYHFKILALNELKIPTPDGKPTGDELLKILEPYIIAQGEVTGTYSTNPSAK